MSRVIDVLVVADPSADEEIVGTLLSADDELRVVGYIAGLHEHQPHADVLVVACGRYDETAATLIGEAVAQNPGRPVVLVCQGAPNGFVDHAFGAGATDLVVLPEPCDVELARGLSHQVRFTLGKAVAQRHRAAQRAGAGRMIAVLGPKGGCGRTLTATNLAVALSDLGQKVVLVDLDLQFGDVGLAMGLTPHATLYDLISSGGSLDEEKLDAFLSEHPSGVRALLAPTRPDQAGLVTPDFLREVYGLLREHNDVVIVDTPPSFTPEVITAIDASSDACMVGMLDALSLKNARLGMETLALMGYDPGHVRFVLNRADSQVGIDAGDVAGIIGQVPDVLVPSDREVTRSVNEGVPIALKARRSAAGRAFHDLAAVYAGQAPERRNEKVVPEQAPKRRRRLALSRSL